MTLKITYKEVLLIVGVVVALAIAVIFWSKGSVTAKSRRTSSIKIQKSVVIDLIEKSVPKILFHELR